MAINSVWVFAQVTNGAATTGTLELLTKARSLSSNVTAVLGGDASGVAAQLGEFGATKVYATGDLAGKLPGVAVSGAMKAIIDGGDKPDLILFPQNYEGRDVLSRLSVKLNKSVLTNSIDVAVDGDAVNATTPIFGGNTLVTTTFTGEGPYLVAFRPKSFAAEASGGAHGRRRGMAQGRFSAWWLVTAFADALDEWPLRPNTLLAEMEELQWFTWREEDPLHGWQLQLAVEDPFNDMSWAFSARDISS